MFTPKTTRGIAVIEAAKRLGISRAQFYKLLNPKEAIYEANFPRPFKIGGRTLFVEDEIEQWLQSHIEANRF
jgi:prophage regulatory protein